MTDAADGARATDEPDALCCPITHCMFREPVFVPESGTTYERSALLAFWRRAPGRRRDVLSNCAITSDTVFVDWNKRREVAAWLSAHPDVTPAGWDDREPPPPRASEATGDGNNRPRDFARLIPRWAVWLPFSLRGAIVVAVVSTALALGFAGTLTPEIATVHRAASPDDPPIVGGELVHSLTTAKDRVHAHARVELIETDSPTATARGEGPPTAAWTAKSSRRSRSTGAPVPVLQARIPPVSVSVFGGGGDGGGSGAGAGAGAAAGEVALAVGWLSFTTFWTASAYAAGAPLLFVCFSAPFWWVGAQLLAMGVAPFLDDSQLTADADGLHLVRRPRPSSPLWRPWRLVGSSSPSSSSSSSHRQAVFVPWDEFGAVAVRQVGVTRGVPQHALAVADAAGRTVASWGGGGVSHEELTLVHTRLREFVRLHIRPAVETAAEARAATTAAEARAAEARAAVVRAEARAAVVRAAAKGVKS